MGIKWRVKFVDPEELEGKLGCTIFSKNLIRLNNGILPKLKEQTFLHELLHAIVWQMGLDKSMSFDDKAEEIVVNTIANGLFAAIEAKVLNV